MVPFCLYKIYIFGMKQLAERNKRKRESIYEYIKD